MTVAVVLQRWFHSSPRFACSSCLALGARVAHTKLLPTVVQTVGIATAAAAGLLVGKLVAG